MSYRRVTFPGEKPSHRQLSAMMAGIGMNVAAAAAPHPNIEDTLYWCSVEGMDQEDYRTLGLLVLWLEQHVSRVNADRLVRILTADAVTSRVKGFWKAIAQWQHKDRRFRRLEAVYSGKSLVLPAAGADFLIQKHGMDERFAGTILRVPKGLLRRREGDVLSPEKLVGLHRAYRWRILQGPTYRADMLAELEFNPDISASELARKTYGSFATAHEALRDWHILKGGECGGNTAAAPQ